MSRILDLLPDPKLSGDGREAAIVCPWCGKRKLYVNLTSGLWLCFRCGITGNRVTLAHDVLGTDDIPDLPARAPVRLAGIPVERLPSEAHPLDNPASRWQRPFWDYLRGRGVSPVLVGEYRIHYALIGRYRNRVLIPVTWHGTICGFVARAIDDRQPKTLNSNGALDIPFNLDRMNRRQPIVLVEGVFDALRLPTMAVATLGARLSLGQREALAAVDPEVITVLRDGDRAGRTRTVQDARDLLGAGFRVRLAALPDGLDPASAPPSVLAEALARAPEVDLGLTLKALESIWKRAVKQANGRRIASKP